MLLQRNKVDLALFVPDVMAMTRGDGTRKGLPAEVAVSFVRDAIIDFARLSSAVCRTEYIRLQPGLCEYPLVDCDSDEEIHSIVEAGEKDCPVETCGLDNGCLVLPDGFGYFSDTLRVEYSVIPCRDACEVDEYLYKHHKTAIVAGALASLHLMPQRPWTSGEAARQRRVQFEEDVAEARKMKLRNRNADRQSVRANFGYVRPKRSGRYIG